jgi:hypothetical protein
MKNAQLSSKFYSPTGVRQQIGTTADEIDPKQLLQFLRYVQKDQPYGLTKTGNLRYLPNQEYIRRLLRGEEKEFNFAAGGLASMIGRKAIKKIAKKLSEKDLKLLMGSFFKGTKPLMGPKYKREMKLAQHLKDKYGKETTWPYVKSKVPGPKSSLQRQQERDFFENTEFYPPDDSF